MEYLNLGLGMEGCEPEARGVGRVGWVFFNKEEYRELDVKTE